MPKERTEYEIYLANISRAYRKHHRQIDAMIRKRIEAKEETYDAIGAEFGFSRTAIANRARMLGSKRVGKEGSHNREKFKGKCQRIVLHIKENIENGSLKPGSKIPRKEEMAKHMMCSVTTVFNAYLILEREGFIVGGEYGERKRVLPRPPAARPPTTDEVVERFPTPSPGN